MDNNYPNKVYTYLNEKKTIATYIFNGYRHYSVQNFDMQYLAKKNQLFKILGKPSNIGVTFTYHYQ